MARSSTSSRGIGEPAEFETFLGTMLTREGRSAAQVALRAKAQGRQGFRPSRWRGIDPVTLLQDQKLVPGLPDLSVEHDGRVFRFANEAAREAFLRQPDSFAPVNGGRCPVSQVDRGDFATGDPRWGVVYQGHLYLFKDVADRDRFAREPERYARLDHSVRSNPARTAASRPRSLDDSRVGSPRCSPRTVPPVGSLERTAARTDPRLRSRRSFADRLSSFLSLDGILRR